MFQKSVAPILKEIFPGDPRLLSRRWLIAGMGESKVWAELGTPNRFKRGFLRFCLRGGRKMLVGMIGEHKEGTRHPAGRDGNARA